MLHNADRVFGFQYMEESYNLINLARKSFFRQFLKNFSTFANELVGIIFVLQQHFYRKTTVFIDAFKN